MFASNLLIYLAISIGIKARPYPQSSVELKFMKSRYLRGKYIRNYHEIMYRKVTGRLCFDVRNLNKGEILGQEQ